MPVKPKNLHAPNLMQSPLINEPVIERAYTGSSEFQRPSESQTNVEEKPQEQQTQKQPEQAQQQQTTNTGEPPNNLGGNFGRETPNPNPEIKEMKFNEGESGQSSESEKTEEGEGEINTAGFSDIGSKVFGDIIIESGATYIPPIISEFTKIDLPTAKLYASKGLLEPHFVDLFENINKNNLDALKLTTEEIDILKKGFRAYLKAKEFEFANETNAFLVSLGMVVARLGITAYNQGQENKKLIAEAFRMTNPDVFKVSEEEYEKDHENFEKTHHKHSQSDTAESKDTTSKPRVKRRL